MHPNGTRSLAMMAAMALSLTLADPTSANARDRGSLVGQEAGGGRSLEDFEAKGLISTDLSPVFPKGVHCPAVSSPFGSPTRYDGSSRKNEHFGLHNGMDITLDTGTPLLAMADGEVVHAGTAGRLVGNFIWVRFPGNATGLPINIFARYQHLDQPSPLSIGAPIRRGQVIGRSGNTGTDGGHYGARGYPHLHLNMVATTESELRVIGATMGSRSSVFFDPLGVFVHRPPAPFTNQTLRDLPSDARRVNVAVMTADGAFIPGNARIIWPVACSG